MEIPFLKYEPTDLERKNAYFFSLASSFSAVFYLLAWNKINDKGAGCYRSTEEEHLQLLREDCAKLGGWMWSKAGG